jgi:hypothetical protein
MKDKDNAKETVKDTVNPISGMAEQAMKNCEQALRTTLKFQQEAGQWWGNLCNQSAPVQDWQKRVANFGTIASGFMPATQKRMEETLELVEKNNRASAELMKKAAEAAQTPVIAESQSKWMDFWASSLGAMRSNAEAAMQINSRALDAWIDFVQKNTEVTEIRVPKTA